MLQYHGVFVAPDKVALLELKLVKLSSLSTDANTGTEDGVQSRMKGLQSRTDGARKGLRHSQDVSDSQTVCIVLIN